MSIGPLEHRRLHSSQPKAPLKLAFSTFVGLKRLGFNETYPTTLTAQAIDLFSSFSPNRSQWSSFLFSSSSPNRTGSSSGRRISRPSRKEGVRICLPNVRDRSPSPLHPIDDINMSVLSPTLDMRMKAMAVADLAKVENIFMSGYRFDQEMSEMESDDENMEWCSRRPGLRPRTILRRTHSWDRDGFDQGLRSSTAMVYHVWRFASPNKIDIVRLVGGQEISSKISQISTQSSYSLKEDLLQLTERKFLDEIRETRQDKRQNSISTRIDRSM
ncbi:hypothetical protein Taro_022625 [Colocasia esculenta]|uniref:Uncharacterized protein n=1 Tax=Colocasia esculenta TaxID=4460 RepID=A0A843V8X6_COLES|nr:hypothetical protein [Colocasia esculenta]